MKRFLLLLLLVPPHCGCTVDSATSEDTEALLGAPIDATHKFDVGVCSGGLVPAGQPNAGTCATFECSGTLIGPNLVLTARHCIRQISYAASFCDSTFTNDPLSTSASLVTTSHSTVVGHPKWYRIAAELVPSGNNLCRDDLALLRLTRVVPGSEAHPAALDLVRNFAARPAHSVAVVGRGVISDVLDLVTFEETTVDGDLERRILQHIPFVCGTDSAAQPCNVVDYSSPPTNMFASPPGYLVIGRAAASGDSGAGVFDQAELGPTGDMEVMGVFSATTYDAQGVPNFGLVERLDTHRDFLRSGVRQAADALAVGASD